MIDRQRYKFVRAIAFVGFLMVLAGCIPAVYTYWQPRGEWGKLINPSEVNIVSKDTLEVRLDEVRVWFSGTGSSFTMTVRIPQGKSATFVSNEVLFYVGDSINTLKFDAITRDNEKDRLLATDIMIGKKLYGRIFGEDEPISYWATIGLGGEERTQYAIKPPPLKVADRVFEMPRIEFTKKTGVGIGSL